MLITNDRKRRIFEFSLPRVVGTALLLALVSAIDSWKEGAQFSPFILIVALLFFPKFNYWQLRGGELLELTLRGWRRHKLKGLRMFVREPGPSGGGWTVTIESQGEKLLEVIGDADPLLCAARVSNVFGIPFDEKSLAASPRLSEAIAAAEDPEFYRWNWGHLAADVFGFLAYVGVFVFAVGKC